MPKGKGKFNGFSVPDVALLPPEFFDLLPEMKSCAELKVTLVALRVSLAFGMNDIPYSLRDFESATGLDRKAVLRGIRAGVARGTLKRVAFGRGFVYRVNFAKGGKMPPHACMQQQANKQASKQTSMQGAKKAKEKDSILKDVIALGVATRVALALVERNDVEKLRKHIAYTRYAAEKAIAKSPAAWFVASVRDDWGPPTGFGQVERKKQVWYAKYEEFVQR